MGEGEVVVGTGSFEFTPLAPSPEADTESRRERRLELPIRGTGRSLVHLDPAGRIHAG